MRLPVRLGGLGWTLRRDQLPESRADVLGGLWLYLVSVFTINDARLLELPPLRPPAL